jgi:hypothetical protein
MRYDESLNTSGFEIGKLTSNASLTVKEYACITLGYELIFVELEKMGLLENDDIAFKISYLDDQDNSDPDDDEYIEYRKVILTGKGKTIPVTKVIALPSGDWKFEETGWGWKYLTPTYYKNEKLDANKITSWPVNITKEQNKKIIVVNTLKPIADPDDAENNLKIQEFEHRKRNILRPNKVVTP